MKFIRKIVAFDDIYTSVVKTFSFEVIFELKKSIYYPDLDTVN
jgi:hypothetical protein